MLNVCRYQNGVVRMQSVTFDACPFLLYNSLLVSNDENGGGENTSLSAKCDFFLSSSYIGKTGQMAADLDMDVSGGEGWGDDAELQLDEGKSLRYSLSR